MRICCIVKPSILPHADAIAMALADAGMPVISRKEVTYTGSLLHALYDHMSEEARAAICARMEGATGLAFLVEAGSVDAFLTLAGRESDPRECAPHTIRARFAKNAPEERIGDWVWFENGFHRPVDEREAIRDLLLIFPEAA